MDAVAWYLIGAVMGAAAASWWWEGRAGRALRLAEREVARRSLYFQMGSEVTAANFWTAHETPAIRMQVCRASIPYIEETARADGYVMTVMPTGVEDRAMIRLVRSVASDVDGG